MKNYIKPISYTIVASLFFVLLSAQAWAVQVTTKAVTQITYNSATATGSITDPWYVTAYGFCWNTDGTPTITDNRTNQGVTTVNVEFSANIPGLDPGTTYYIRAYAREWYGTYFYGNVTEFTTDNALPIVTTQDVTDIKKKSALGHGTIVELGISNPTQHGVCWNQNGNPTIADKKTREGPVSQVGPFTSEITKLKSDKTYYVRAYATNSTGTAYGNEVTFTTGATLPSISTQMPTGIEQNQAIANGTILDLGAPNPNQHGFCWNTTGLPDLGDFILEMGEVEEAELYSALIEGLTSNTTYFIRAYATNTAGTVFGDEVSFTTLASTPTVTTEAVSDIGVQSALGHGTIIDLGSPNPNQHGVCWNTSGNPIITDNKTMEGSVSETGPFESTMNELIPATTYYVRAYATNEAGTGYGDEVSFTTDPMLPSVQTKPVSDIGTHSAVANGAVLDLGSPAAYQHGFCWNSIGNPNISDSKAELGNVSETGDFNALIADLVPNTTYYIRAYASNAGGTSYGDEVEFSSANSASAPIATIINAPAKITNTTAYSIQVGGIGVISYKYRLNNDNWSNEQQTSEPMTFVMDAEGEMTLAVIGKSDANMWQSDDNPTLTVWHIDTTPPVAELYNYPSGTLNSDGTEVVVGGYDVVSYQYRVNGGAWSGTMPIETRISLADLLDGEYLLEVIGADLANNWQDEILATRISWTHDTTVPTAVLSNIPNSVTNQTITEITVTNPKNGIPISAYAYTIDDGHTWWSLSADESIELTGLSEGAHLLCVNAFGAGLWQDGLDGMSSVENATCIQWRVDVTPADPVLLSADINATMVNSPSGMPGTASVLLAWEWSSDDDLETLQRYRVWYSENPITEADLDSATEVFCDLIPGMQGIQEFFSIDGLIPERQYHFGVKTIDGAGNLSDLSNVVTLVPEDLLPKIDSIGLTEGGLVTDNATIRELSIAGLNFLAASGCNRVRFESDDRVFDITAKSGTTNQILADIPMGSPPGDYYIRVINKHGISTASTDMISITDASLSTPVVTEIHPLVAEIGAQTVLTVIGKNFDETGVSVNLISGDETATPLSSVMVHDSETITAIVNVPEDFAEGQYHVQVINSDGRLNQVSAIKIELCNPVILQSDTSSIVTTKSIDIGIGAIPAKTTLTTDDRNEVAIVNKNRSRIKVFLDSGSAFEIGSQDQTEWADYTGTIRPPRQITINENIQSYLGKDSVTLSIGIDDFLRLKNDASMFALIEVPLPAVNADPLVYYIAPEGDLTLAGVEGAWRGLTLDQGGTILAKRFNTPESGMTTYTIGLLLNSMSDYAIGSTPIENLSDSSGPNSDDYGMCFVSTLNTVNMVLMHGVILFSIFALILIYFKKYRR